MTTMYDFSTFRLCILRYLYKENVVQVLTLESVVEAQKGMIGLKYFSKFIFLHVC